MYNLPADISRLNLHQIINLDDHKSSSIIKTHIRKWKTETAVFEFLMRIRRTKIEIPKIFCRDSTETIF